MDFTPTICIARLLVALQVLMTLLVMPLSSVMMTTSALPVTSKPIESTAENLAWQAWIMLPPEQKQLIKSRKVTPKSIFTLPHRVQCPEGHQQVDMKCIPTVVGSNAVLIDVLGLVLGDAPTADVEYDYEDEPVMGDASNAGNMPFNPPLYLTAGNDGKSHTETVLELKPPSQDEPLKFNIFQSKFPTDDYPMEDYSGISNEGGSAQAPTPVVMEEEKQLVVNTSQTLNVTNSQDLTGEASNVSKTHTLSHLPAGGEFNLASLEAISVPASGQGHDQNRHTISLFNEDSAIHLVTTMMDTEEEEENRKEGDKEKSNSHDLESLLQTESLMPMLNHTTASTIMALDSLPLLQSNSSQPMELENPVVQIENVDEMTTILPDLMSSGHTTLADDDVEQQTKAEFIRSVTMNPLYDEYVNEEGVVEEEQDDEFTTTLTPSSSNDIEMWQKMKEREDEADDDDAVETTTMDPLTTIQLDDTTIIEGNIEITTIIPQEQEAVESSLTRAKTTTTTTTTRINEETITPTSSTTTPASDKKQLIQDFEELQKDQQRNVKQKSKVEPVEVLATRTTASPATTTTASSAASTSGAMASQHETTTTTDELITSGETVTPLLTVHNNGNDNIDNNKNNNNDNNNDVNKANNKNSTSNDRFYYQHFAKQDLESAALKSDVAKETPTTTVTTTAPTALPSTTAVTSASAEVSAKAPAATSEIDLAEELRLINELVKGKRPGITLNAAEATTLKTTTTTTRKTTKTTTTSQNDDVDNEIHTSPKPMAPAAASASPVPAPSESSASSAMKYSLETTKIWSKIMPLIKTTTTTTTTEKPPEVSGNSKTSETSLGNLEEKEESSAAAPSTSSGQTETTATTTTTPNAASLVVSNRSHRNSKIIRINGLNSLDYKQGKKATTTTTANEDISSTTSTEANPEETSTRESKSSGENDDENIETHDDDDEVADDSAYGSFWWLPISWRLDGSSNKESSSSSSSTTTTSTTAKPQETSSQQQQQEDMPLLLRFWSTYHAPKSS